jgi:hypothetical protein
MPQDDLFRVIDETLRSASLYEALDLLIEEFRQTRRHDLLFEARRMRKRMELGLPLIQTEALSCSADQRAAYDEATIDAARESGLLCLATGQISAGYRYLRAIGETGPVADAIAKVDPNDDVEEIIEIAFQEGIHPAKGLDLILRKHGMCRAITAFGMYAVDKDRDQCIALLVRELHAEIAARLSYAIEQREGVRPGVSSLSELIAGREWLFGEYDYYVDTSHLTSVISYCLEVSEPEILRQLDELCDYGQHLSPTFAFKGNPPFEDGYIGYGRYVKALRGIAVDEQVDHFRRKAIEADPEVIGNAPAQELVNLLARLGRYDAALEAWLQFLVHEEPAYLRCPSPMELCYRSGNFERLRELARERADLLTYTAASVLQSGGQPLRRHDLEPSNKGMFG